MKKTIIAQLSIQESKTEEFLNLAHIMVKSSNAEKGCLTYKLMQNTHLLNDYMFFEEYENIEAVNTHNSSAHFNSFLNAVKPLLNKEPIIEIF